LPDQRFFSFPSWGIIFKLSKYWICWVKAVDKLNSESWKLTLEEISKSVTVFDIEKNAGGNIDIIEFLKSQVMILQIIFQIKKRECLMFIKMPLFIFNSGFQRSPRLILSLMLVWVTFFVVTLSSVFSLAGAEVVEVPTNFLTLSQSDGIEYKWNGVKRVVAIGDIHGDLNALLKILFEKQLIERSGHWIGSEAHLVMIGDLVNGADNSRDILDYLIGLEKEAEFSRGKLHVVLGNHELRLLFGDTDALSYRNLKGLVSSSNISRSEMEKMVIHDFNKKKGIYTNWLKGKNSIVVINDVAFVHAGLRPEWFRGENPRQRIRLINSTVRYLINYARHLENVDPRLLWTVGLEWNYNKGEYNFNGALGPIWDRGFGTRELKKIGLEVLPSIRNSVPRLEFEELMDGLGLIKMVAGHNPVKSGNIYVDHPYYEELVTILDTRISKAFGGQLSAFEMNLNSENVLQFEGTTFNRPRQEHRMRRVINELKKATIGRISLYNKCEFLNLK
jgi:hypothetical protein